LTYYRQRDGIVKSVEGLIQRVGTAPGGGQNAAKTMLACFWRSMRSNPGQSAIIETIGDAAGSIGVGRPAPAARNGGGAMR
jgi:hypothetical protein